jgi:hypothetical protein
VKAAYSAVIFFFQLLQLRVLRFYFFQNGKVRVSIPSKWLGSPGRRLSLDVFGFVNYAHSAATEFFYDAVVRDSLPDHPGQILRGVNPASQ